MSGESCPLCEDSRNRFRFDHGDHTLVTCENCGLHFITPYPIDASVYERVSDYDYEELEINPPEQHYDATKTGYARFYPRIKEICQDAGSILDIGCGTGHLLELLCEFEDLQRTGIELNAARAAFARKIAKCEIHETPLENWESNTRYDVVSLMAVFSHVPHPKNFIREIRDRMADHGRLVLYVGEYAHNIKKQAVFDWEIPDHLQFLGLTTLDWVAAEFGFKVIRRDRVRLSEEMFSRHAFQSRGRSKLRNALKAGIVRTPGLLWGIRRSYEICIGGEAYATFAVLQADDG